jgi:hypothetical protein
MKTKKAKKPFKLNHDCSELRDLLNKYAVNNDELYEIFACTEFNPKHVRIPRFSAEDWNRILPLAEEMLKAAVRDNR